MIENPVLRGFNPDPSIIRVNNNYYIATSTFEWFPGVRIHHSIDLVNWYLVAAPLNTKEKLDLLGVPDSGGIWAPCLSYSEDVFYLVYSIVRSWTGVYKDVDNYLITTENISGEWSEPIYLCSAGFDASLFHDSNTGIKWLAYVNWDYRKSSKGNSVTCFDGILLQEYDPQKQKLAGPVTTIFRGTELGLVEAPHIYYKDGYYYLMTAEGGTFKEHAVTLCKAKNIKGPYEVHPDNPVLTSYNDESLYLQRSGHASLVETESGKWYLAHLCGRPHMPEFRCNLGRETALQKMEWKQGWLYVEGGGNKPLQNVPQPGNDTVKKEPQMPEVCAFEDRFLPKEFNTLRVPMDESWVSLTKKAGRLSVRGRESLFSKHYQSTIARRVQHFNCIAETKLSFTPASHFQSAGLIYYYNTENHYYLRLTFVENLGVVCNILVSDKAEVSIVSEPVPIKGNHVIFQLRLTGKTLRFFYSLDGEQFIPIGETLDATKMSDEYCGHHFTGSFVGMHVEDMAYKHAWAEFEYFKYEEV